jgi:hypothetical protein
MVCLACSWLLSCVAASPAEALCIGCGCGELRSAVTERFLQSSSVVGGDVTYTALPVKVWHQTSADPNDPNDWYHSDLYRFQLRVRESLYGRPVGELVTVDWECHRDNAEWLPKVGDKAVVFIGHERSAMGDAPRAVHAWRLTPDGRSKLDDHRRVGEILRLVDIDEQVRAVIDGCLSGTSEFREWCFEMISMEAYPIRRRLGKQGMWDVAMQCFASQRHDLKTLLSLDEILDRDPGYYNSDRRYDALWAAAYAHAFDLRGDDISTDREFSDFFFHLTTTDPNRADESLIRMIRFIQDRRVPDSLRTTTLVYLDELTHCISITGLSEALEFFESAASDPNLCFHVVMSAGRFGECEKRLFGNTSRTEAAERLAMETWRAEALDAKPIGSSHPVQENFKR